MASTIALQYPHLDLPQEPEQAPKRRFGAGLLDRVKKVGDRLRNVTREDAAYFGLTVGAGLGAKAGAVAGLAALGLGTGGIGYAALGVAFVGGTAVGLTKNIINTVREARAGKETSFFSLKTLKSTASSAAISVATLGYSDLFEFTTGETLGHALGRAFGKVSDIIVDKFATTGQAVAAAKQQAIEQSLATHFAPASTSSYVPFETEPAQQVAAAPQAAPQVTEHQTVPKASAPEPTKTAAPQTTKTAALSAAQAKAAAAAALAAAQDKAANEFALNRLRELVQNTTGVAAPATATAEELAKQFHPSNPNAFLNGLKQSAPQLNATELKAAVAQSAAPAAAPAAAQAPAPQPSAAAAPAPQAAAPATAASQTTLKVPAETSGQPIVDVSDMQIEDLDPRNLTIRTASGVELKLPAMPDMGTELNTVRGALFEAAFEEQVRQDFKTFFPNEGIPANAKVEDLAARLHPENPTAYLVDAAEVAAKGLQASGIETTLNPAKMAGSCVGDLPSTQDALNKQDGRLPNSCYVSKDTMEPGDYVTVRDGAEAKPTVQRGLRVLFSQISQKTSDFIANAVSRETLPEMATQKLAPAFK